MEITEEVRQVLTCKECNELLSCGPVYLVHGTSAAICGRCSSQPQEKSKEDKDRTLTSKSSSEGAGRSRNLQYEAAARLLSFPCQFASQGCPEKMAFSSLGPNSHEHLCPFRTLVCPIVERGSCNWVGSRQKLQEHCCEVHPDHLYASPCLLPRPDLTKSHLKNYLISAFNFLFLLQLKVSLTSSKLYHAVRIFNGTEFLDKFSYYLEIDGNNKILTEQGPVLDEGLMMLQEPTAISTSINTLLSFFSGRYEDTKFTLTINTSLKFCLNCSKVIVSNSKYCEDCQQKMVKCDFNLKGCLFVDVNKYKCIKHKNFFCKFQTKCFLPRCGANLVAGSFIEHLGFSTSCRNTIEANLNSVIRVVTTFVYNRFILLASNFGTIICEYYLNNSCFRLCLYSSFPFCDLKKLNCSFELTDPQTNFTVIKTLEIQENTDYDWFISENMNNFPSSTNTGIDLKINIT